jgi:malonyl CoA-acyl carrier protein transacylase
MKERMSTALLFPGQGAPAAGWREAVSDRRPDLLDQARESLGGEDPFERFGDGTEYDQPAIYCASLAAFEIAGQPRADYFAGHSLGEISALACAGALDHRQGLGVVVERGRLMAAAGRPPGSGSMLAVRASAAEVEDVTERQRLAVANLNSPAQTVLSGESEAIERAAAELSDRRLLTKVLPVSGAFHSPQMVPAAAGLKRALAPVELRQPVAPVLSARTGLPFEDVRAELAASLTEPVSWIEVVATLERAGIERYIEIGPGKALAGLVRKCAAGEVLVESTAVPEAAGA